VLYWFSTQEVERIVSYSIGGELRASNCTIDGVAGFNDIQVFGGARVFDGGRFGEKADFATIAVSKGGFSATETVSPDKVWFTHAVINEY
jgi:hypothetical protein